MMKTCPVCGAACFDDMTICYGCMHDFARGEKTAAADVVPDASSPRRALTLPLVIADDSDERQNCGRHAINLDVTVRVEGPKVSKRSESALSRVV